MNREMKKRFKMYKSGKNWVIAPIVFLGLTAGFGHQANVKADNVSSTAKADNETAQKATSTALNDQKAVALKSSASTKTNTQATEETTNFAVQPAARAATSSSKNDQNTANKSQKPVAAANDQQQTNDQTAANANKETNQTTTATQTDQKQPATTQTAGQNGQAQAQTDKTSSSAASSSSVSQKVEQAQEHDDAVQINQNGQWFLQNKETHQNYTGFQYIKDQNKTVYYNPTDGAMVYGQQKINNQWYYFDKITGAMKLGYYWIAEQQKEVYYDPNKGNMVYGQQKINGHWQYFDDVTGAQAKSKYVWIGDQNKEVYYDGLGNMVYGQQKINGKWQWFDIVTGAQAKSQYVWIDNQNKEVYYDDLGNMVYGQQEINGKWQWFDPVTGAQAKSQYVWIGNQNKEVYYDGLGNMVYGQQKINGKWQWFDPVTGAQAKSKFVYIKDQNKTVYYDDLGNMVYGQQNINGHWYLFDKVTGAMQTGFQYIPEQNKLVYYNNDGQMLYGRQTINGITYTLNNVTGAVEVRGQQNIGGHWYYFDNNGNPITGYYWIGDQNKEVYYDPQTAQMVYGQQNINGYWQYFDPITGAQAKSQYVWIADQDKEVYYDGLGNMVYGQQYINGHWQYFDTVTGAQVKSNFQWITDQQKLCYYDGLGNMVYGQQTINGQSDYFNTVTGAYEIPTSELASYRDDVANQINAILKNEGKDQMDANWTGDQNNFEAFGLHDTAQLVAQGQLNNDEQSIEINLQNNQLMNGTAKAYQVTVTAPTKEQAAQEAAQKIVSMLGNNTSNWKALGVGATIQDSNNNKNWNTTVIFYNPSQESQFVKKTSNVQYKITNVYNNAGDVQNALQNGAMNPADLVNAGLSDTAKTLLTGIQGDTISSENLEALANAVGGMTKAFVGTTTYYDKNGNPYHYEYWLDGNQEAGKQQEVANDNKNVKFGDTVTLDYNATLVYGKAEDTTTTESTKPSTEMTADEITNAFKNGTETGLRYDKVVVTPIKGMTNDMIRGVDISSYKSLENAGVTFYDFNGNPASLVKILHDAGVNYLRLRLWSDPYNASNQNYGGGVCDEASEMAIAKEAAKYGMKVMLDLQYSDFWADPGKQIVPKAWQNLNPTDIQTEVFQYTRKIMNDFKNAGIDVGMVQTGNEITNGMLGQSTDRDHGGSYQGAWDDPVKAFNICNYLNAGAKAIRQELPSTKITIQLETPNIDKYTNIMTVLQQHDVDYDVLGSSYYPFWSCADNNGHGLGTGANTPNNLLAVEKMVAEKFNKQFVVLETSWASTTQDADGTGNSIGDNNTKWQNTNMYPVGPQGQVDEIEALYKALVAGNGLGAFYWEPAWIPDKAGWVNWQYNDAMSEVFGTGWANSHSVGYSPDSVMYYNGKPAWGGTTWDNMAMFDDHGYALQSLNVFKGMLDGYTSPDTINYAPLKQQTTTVTTPPFNSGNSSSNSSNSNSNNSSNSSSSSSTTNSSKPATDNSSSTTNNNQKPATDNNTNNSNNNQKPATQTATSNIQYKVTAVYDAPGVDNVTVPNALKVGDVVKDMPSSVPTSVSGTKGDKLSASDLNKVASAIGSNGVDGTQLQKSVQYPNSKGHYFYKYYVQQGFDATKANENVTYGSPITVNVTATLTWTAD